MKHVKIYSFEVCPFCVQAKLLLQGLDVDFEEIIIDRDEVQELAKKTNMLSVPQIFIGDELIGGFTDLAKLQQENKLMELLKD